MLKARGQDQPAPLPRPCCAWLASCLYQLDRPALPPSPGGMQHHFLFPVPYNQKTCWKEAAHSCENLGAKVVYVCQGSPEIQNQCDG